MKNIVQRAMGCIAAVAVLASISGCSKSELTEPAGNSVGIPRSAVDYFVRVLDSGLGVPNYSFTVHCGSTLTTNANGFIPWGGGCPNVNQVSVDAECFLWSTWYYLKPPGGHAARKFLKFRFLPGFSSTGVTLAGYTVNTLSWTVASGIPNFQYQIISAKTVLPLCH